MTNLSPAAQEVLQSYKRGGLNAALEAAADQVVPEQKPWHRTSDAHAAEHAVRLRVLSIAAELEAHQ